MKDSITYSHSPDIRGYLFTTLAICVRNTCGFVYFNKTGIKSFAKLTKFLPLAYSDLILVNDAHWKSLARMRDKDWMKVLHEYKHNNQTNATVE